MLTLLANILGALNSDAEPNHIALAVAFSMLIGFNPILGLVSLFVIILVLSLRVHLTTFIALSAVFSALAILIAPILSLVGETLLANPSLSEFWTGLYQTYWFRLFKFNNSLVLGGALVSLLLFIPFLLASRYLVVKYRLVFMAYVNKFKIVQSLKASKFFRIYQAVNQG